MSWQINQIRSGRNVRVTDNGVRSLDPIQRNYEKGDGEEEPKQDPNAL